MPSAFVCAYPPATPNPGPAFWLPFRGAELLASSGAGGVALIYGATTVLAELEPGPPVYLGTLNGVPCLACEIRTDTVVPEGWQLLGLRALYGQLDDEQYTLAGYASQLLLAQRTGRFCSACGEPTEAATGDWGRRCTACGYTRYPPVSPAVLILVHRDDTILLARQPGWGNRYSILAGFVEPGESLEQCVQREVFEEVRLEVTDLTYAGSQPWPYPHQVMIGFRARYAGGEVTIDTHELDDARWFQLDHLPELPAPLSLSRQLIDAWVAARRARHGA